MIENRMIENRKSSNGLKLVIGLCALAMSTGLQVSPGNAQAPIPAKYEDKPYFVEFRARSAYNYGHTFLVHGRVGQRITKRDVVGLHPATESPLPWMIGHLVPVPSETGASDGDDEDVYIIARYRVYLSEAEYKPVLAKMREWQRSTPLWHAGVYNCNAFVGSVARYMGLQSPNPAAGHLQLPKAFITELKTVNGARDTLSGSRGMVAAASAARPQTAASNDRQQAAATPAAEASAARPQTAAAAPKRDRKPEAAKPALRQEASAAAAQRPALGNASW
jgi:hypothetical protein